MSPLLQRKFGNRQRIFLVTLEIAFLTKSRFRNQQGQNQ